MKSIAITEKEKKRLTELRRWNRQREASESIPKDKLVEALRMVSGNASEVARVFGVSRQRVHQYLQQYEIDASALRLTARSQHLVCWKLPADLVKSMPEMGGTTFLKAFEYEADEMMHRALRGNTLCRVGGERAGLDAEKIEYALRLNDGSVSGVARDLLVAPPTVLYWLQANAELLELRDQLVSVKHERVRSPVPDSIARVVVMVARALGTSKSATLARLLRGVAARSRGKPTRRALAPLAKVRQPSQARPHTQAA